MNDFLSVATSSAISLLIAILSGLGVGSGGLFVIWLTAAYGVSATQARGMNLLFFVFSASSALTVHIFKGKLDLKLIGILSIFALIGTLIGTTIAQYVSPGLLKEMFGVFLVSSGAYSLFYKKNKKI